MNLIDIIFNFSRWEVYGYVLWTMALFFCMNGRSLSTQWEVYINSVSDTPSNPSTETLSWNRTQSGCSTQNHYLCHLWHPCQRCVWNKSRSIEDRATISSSHSWFQHSSKTERILPILQMRNWDSEVDYLAYGWWVTRIWSYIGLTSVYTHIPFFLYHIAFL